MLTQSLFWPQGSSLHSLMSTMEMQYLRALRLYSIQLPMHIVSKYSYPSSHVQVLAVKSSHVSVSTSSPQTVPGNTVVMQDPGIEL